MLLDLAIPKEIIEVCRDICIGGFIAADKETINWMRHSVRPYIFTASIPPSATASVIAAKVKEKYPQYKDIDDLTLAQKVIEKYPEYKEQVTFEGVQEPKKDYKTLLHVLTPERVAEVFFGATGRQKQNYYPEVYNFFSLLLSKYAH